MKGLKPVSKLNIRFAAAIIIVVIALAGCKEDDPVKVSGVSLNKTTLELAAGGSETLTATVTPADAENKAVAWSSSNGTIATVDQNGAVKAVAAGTVTITVTTADGGKTASCTVTVSVTAADGDTDDGENDGNDDGEKPASTPTLRYETVPYAASEAKSSGAYKLAYSSYDDDYNYYFFVLGHVNNLPLAYIGTDVIYYDGVTPITISYSQENVSQEVISNSIQDAVTYSFTQSSSTNWELGAQIGTPNSFKLFKFQVSGKIGGSSGWDETNSRSLANTYETSRSTMTGTAQGQSLTIGENGEPVGRYRWALFTTTDVYYYVKTDRARTRVVEAFTEFCPRPDLAWRKDYDPEERGPFGKTGKGELLEIPDIVPSALPDPENPVHTHEWGEWKTAIPATCTTEGTEIRTCTLDPSHTEPRTIPATGHDWDEWQETTAPTATTPGVATRICKNDPAHPADTRGFKAIYSNTDFSAINVNNTAGIRSWQPPASEFDDIEFLKELGYTKFNIKVEFSHRANGTIFNSESNVSIISDSGSEWKKQNYRKIVGIWTNHNLETSVNIDEYSNVFSVQFVRANAFDFTVGARTVTVTAVKE